ncbi:MAG: conjugal transfer protein TraG, partial [Betaproteobacteria bacterium]|nr:conjugal transfer protein TraG [Betaproteobacteria bacterium]
IYTAVFGWIMYDQLWQILLDTGIVYFVIFGIFVRIAVESFVRQGAVEGSQASIREAEIAVIGIFTVALLAGAPFINLRVGDLGTAQVCGSAATTGGNTGTTYDDAYAAINGRTAQVPLWWYGILAVFSGITDAAIAAVPCTPDFRVLDYKVDNTRIADPDLRRQLQLFANDCWRPALAQFNGSHATLPPGYAADDINWPGSQFFVDTNGYYGNTNLNLAVRASEEIPRFPYNANRDTEYLPGFIPQWGRPECKDWWTNPSAGLRKRILDQFNNDTLTVAKAWLQSAAGGNFSQVAAENTLIRKVFEGDRVALTSQPSGANGFVATAANAAVHWESAWMSGKLYLLKQAAPIVQSYVLMGIYLLLPFIIVFSGFSILTVFTVSLVIFALKFCSALWAIATWLDDNMMSALGVHWYDHFFDHASEGTADAVASLCSMVLFIGLPALWFLALGWLGVRGASSLSGSEFTSPIQTAGDRIIGLGPSIMKSGITKAAGKQ